MTPVRIQRRRTKGWKMPPNTVCVDRSTRWGNPFHVGMWRDFTAADAVRSYKGWMRRDPSYASCDNAFGAPPSRSEIVAALRGKNLACFCAVGQPCHGDVLLKLANPASRKKPPP